MKGESTHLLVNSASAPSTDRSSTFSLSQWRNTCCLPLRHLCLPSKAAILILCWMAMVGVAYYAAVDFAAMLIASNVHHFSSILIHDVISYATLALVLIFYPLSGFIADVFCGRLKMVKSSIVVLLISFVLVGATLVVVKTMKQYNYYSFTHDQGILVIILACLSLLLFIIGLVGYQANIIQLGLDQLFEAPSQYLGLFIHYATWIFHSGALPWVTIIPQQWRIQDF